MRQVIGFRKFSIVIAAVLLALAITQTRQVAAQTIFWIQVESQQSLRDTRDRAQFFARSFAETHAFETTTGWNAIVLGPMNRAEADARLGQLKGEGLIPSDSLISDGATFRGQLWPLSADNATAAVETPVVEPAASAETATVAETAAADDPVAETTPAEPETTEVAEATTPAEPEAEVPLLEPDPDVNETRRLEFSWSRDEKMQIQTWMVWTGDYTAGIDGAYGPGTRGAIRSFQEREGYEPTGYLRQKQVDLLRQRYLDMITELGMAKVRDLDAGIEMMMPMNFVKFTAFEPPFVRYGPKGADDVTVLLISQSGDQAALKALHDVMETMDFVPEEGYRAQRRDWFVLSGQGETTSSYTYARTERGIVKGFSLIWPRKLDRIMLPFATRMYESFTPLQEYVLADDVGPDTGEDGPKDLTAGLQAIEPVRAMSGFLVNASGVVVTHPAAIAQCKRVTVGEETDMTVLAQNRGLGIAILKPASPIAASVVATFAAEAVQLGMDVKVAGFSFPEVMDVATLNYGTLTDTSGLLGNEAEIRVSAFLEDGDAGGPVLNDQGAVIAMQLGRDNEDGKLPEYVNFALKSDLIMTMLERHEIAFERSSRLEAMDIEDIADLAAGFTVKVSCWN